MERLNRVISCVLFLLFPIASFSKQLVPVTATETTSGGLTVTVKDEKGPLQNAQVWIENIEGKELAEGLTNSQGRFITQLTDQVLSSRVSITAFYSNHAIVSFLENISSQVDLELPITPPDQFSILDGKLSGFNFDHRDPNDLLNQAKVGFVAKALEMSDLVQLESSHFVSPLKDTIDVFGSREIPSNLVLPDQTFWVYLVPIHVNKPNYRLPMLTGSSSHYFGVTGTVEVEDAISAIRNNNGWAVMDMVQFKRLAFTPEIVAPEQGKVSLDLVTDIAITKKSKVKPGRNLSQDNQTKRVLVALWEPTAGTFVPSDIKQQIEDELTLNLVDPSQSRFLDVISTQKGERLRGAWLPSAVQSTPDAGLHCEMTVPKDITATWQINRAEDAQVMVARLETEKLTSIKSKRIEDNWILVGPVKTTFRLPSLAYHALEAKLSSVNHVSLDLLDTAIGGYPFINGSKASASLKVLQKMQSSLHNSTTSP